MDITLFLLRFCKGKNLSKILQGTCSFLDNFPSLFPKCLGNFLICQKRKSNLRESFQVHRIAPSSWNTVINTGVPNFLQSDIYATKSSWSAVHKNEMESLIDFDKDFSLKKKKMVLAAPLTRFVQSKVCTTDFKFESSHCNYFRQFLCCFLNSPISNLIIWCVCFIFFVLGYKEWNLQMSLTDYRLWFINFLICFAKQLYRISKHVDNSKRMWIFPYIHTEGIKMAYWANISEL